MTHGCGVTGLAGSQAQGIDVSYRLFAEQINILKKYKAIKVRVYTFDGYVECNIKKGAQTIIKALEIIK
jgi:hypothetical protein